MRDNRVSQLLLRLPAFHRGVLLTGAGTAVSITLLFIETILAVRWLAPQDYGAYVLLIAIVNLGIILVDFGCKTSVTQMIASGSGQLQSALANNALVFRLVVVAACSTLVLVAGDALALLDPSAGLTRYVAYVPLLLAVASYDELLSAILQGFRAYFPMAAALVGRSVLRLLLSVVLLGVFRLGVEALIYSWVLSFIASAAFQYAMLPISRRPSLQPRLLARMLSFGLPLQGDRLLWFLFSRVNVILIGALSGPTGVAFYAVAARIPEALQRLSESYLTVYFPTVTNWLATGNRQRAVGMLNRSLRLIAFGTALMALLAVLFGEQVIVLLFSEQYAPSGLAFAVLMIAFHITFIGNLMGYTLTAAGRPGRSFVHNVGRTSLNIIGNLVLIPVLGFVGPAFATTLAAYTANPLAIWLLRRTEVAVNIAPFVRQTLLLIGLVGLFAVAQPVAIAAKGAILAAFLVLSFALSTVSLEDLTAMLPSGLPRRASREQEAATRW